MKCFVHSYETEQRIAIAELIVGHGTYIIKPEAETSVIMKLVSRPKEKAAFALKIVALRISNGIQHPK